MICTRKAIPFLGCLVGLALGTASLSASATLSEGGILRGIVVTGFTIMVIVIVGTVITAYLISQAAHP